MPAPQADPPRCDVYGCGMLATDQTDGTEKDVQDLGRPAVPLINHCKRHSNWPHSDDAKRFALTDANYQSRQAAASKRSQ